ncbi:MAG: hypothetical protein KDB96_16275 [Flavobacteriales bacterium]|nr:hypothetical protein [Flavobacteriales bacterium]
MRAPISLLAVVAVTAILGWTRYDYSSARGWTPIKVTTSDALGYYLYLPGAFIHHDLRHQAWLEKIHARYDVQGERLYQVVTVDDGDPATMDPRVGKYLGGVAILQAPFFFLGHAWAGWSGAPQDGFSSPYQLALSIGAIGYALLALLLLRVVLLRWFPDVTVAATLVLLVLATNAIQYISVDGAQSHAWLFPLYALVLYTTQRWHERPTVLWAALTGATIGLATIGRPTEAIMLFIPLLWGTQDKTSATAKWKLVRDHRSHVLIAIAAGLVAVLPQLVYWQYVTGSWVFDVGSKWDFLTPHLRVLFGWEKGWFIYTPITVLFIAGLFFMKGMPWRRSVLVFTVLNLWIITAWHDWRYGGSYSTRALVQSYPVLALPFAALLQRAFAGRWRWPVAALCTYLLAVNLFQIKQYNDGTILYDGMNGPYYRAIYLKAHPTEADRALLEGS